MQLDDRRILVTGASSGIGRATSILLSKLGARLLLTGRDSKRLEATLRLLEGSEHVLQSFDLADVDSIPLWMKNLSRLHGPFNGVVHCAGLQETRPLRAISYSDLETVMKINVGAMFALAKGLRQPKVHSAESSFVAISSVMGLVGQPAVSTYSASKGAVISAVKSLALELARQHIRVNCIAPGHVQSEMSENFKNKITEEDFLKIVNNHPLGIGTTLDVANAIAFLLADTGKWITGSTLVVDGGYTIH